MQRAPYFLAAVSALAGCSTMPICRDDPPFPHRLGVEQIAPLAPADQGEAHAKSLSDAQAKDEPSRLYFEALKEKIRSRWEPRLQRQMLQRDPTGQCFLKQDRFTVVRYVLDSSGYVVDAWVVKRSGVALLDNIGVASLLNLHAESPPPAIFNDEPRIEMTFGFFISRGQTFPQAPKP